MNGGHAGNKKKKKKLQSANKYMLWKLESDCGNKRINSFYMRGGAQRFVKKGEKGIVASEFKVLNFL